MTQQVVRAKINLTTTDTLTDLCSLDLYLEATGSNPNLDFATSQTPQDAIAQFFNTNWGTHALCDYLSPTVSRVTNATRIDWTDITAHLDGSVAGAPFRSDSFSIGATTSTAKMPPQLAAACGYRRAYGGDLERGVSATLPSSESAQDQGAPPTHTGVTRPRARDRGRFFFGPLCDLALDTNVGQLNATFISDLNAAMHNTLGLHNALSANQFQFVQWSRRNASVGNIAFKFADEGVATQRRREDTTLNRVHSWTAL